MIRRFADKETEVIWKSERSRRLPSDDPADRAAQAHPTRSRGAAERHARAARQPVEESKGKRKGTYSVRINDQWRITFRWSGGDAYDVPIEDYH
jgi:proteic killer suppression protein